MVGWNLPNIILEGCLWGVIWPQAIGDMFGQNKKTQVLGLLTSVNTSTQVFSPVIGNLADKMSPRFSRLCGRRRPFVLTGHLTYCTGIVLCYNGLYDKKLELMIFGQLLMGFSGMLQGPNIMAWNAETIPAAQRNTNGAIAQTYMALGQLAMNLLGILVGEGWVEHHLGVGREPFRGQDGDRTIWYMVMVWKFFMVPFMMMQFNSRAGCWWPEISKSKQEERSESQLLATSADYRSKGGADYRKGTRSFVVRNEHSKWLRYNPSAGGSAYFCNDELNVCTLEPPPEGILGDASPEFSDFAQRFSADSLRSGGHGCMQRTRERARDFFSAFFDEPAFLWFYVVAVIGTISGNFMGPFFFYFLQDCFPSGYVLFGWRITKSNQTMISLLGMMGNIIVGLTSWTSKALSERFGARQMQIYSNGGPGTPFGGLVNQFEPFTYALFPGIFPLLFFWQIHDALMNGFGAAAGYVRTHAAPYFLLHWPVQAHLLLRADAELGHPSAWAGRATVVGRAGYVGPGDRKHRAQYGDASRAGLVAHQVLVALRRLPLLLRDWRLHRAHCEPAVLHERAPAERAARSLLPVHAAPLRGPHGARPPYPGQAANGRGHGRASRRKGAGRAGRGGGRRADVPRELPEGQLPRRRPEPAAAALCVSLPWRWRCYLPPKAFVSPSLFFYQYATNFPFPSLSRFSIFS